MQEAPPPPICEVVILTALGLEYKAVSEPLQDMQEVTHQGTVYGYGNFTGQYCTWHVAVAEIGMGGPTAATETERAISYFRPRITLFVGVGGGLKDVKLGDVVAASKVYAYESGKVGQQFQPRPEAWRASHALEQRARAEARNDEWLTRLSDRYPDSVPVVHIGALAAGEKVLASTQSDLFRLLKATYSDTLAVEMEGHGFLAAVHANHSVHGLVIRGISDLIDGKSDADATGSQIVAARHAAAFAFQVLAKFTLPEEQRQTSPLPVVKGGEEKEVFKAYIKEIEALLLKDQLSDRDKALIRKVTLDTLIVLDNRGKAEVLKFLYDSKLIQAPQPAIDLSGANLKGIDLNRVNLSNASLRGVDLSNAHLEYATLRNADLQDAQLSYANLESTELSNANLARVSARSVKLMMADLSGADLTEAVLMESDLSFIGLEGANLTGAFLGTLGSVDSGRTNLYRAHLDNARMNMINLVNANLCGADLSEVKLINADLRGADLQDAKIAKAELSGADLRGTILERVDFEDVVCSFYLPLGTPQQQVAAIEQELKQAGSAMTKEEKARIAQIAQTRNVVSPKQLAIKLKAIGILVTEEQAAKIWQARPILINTGEFLIPGNIPYWKVSEAVQKTDREGEILENRRKNEKLKDYLESHTGISVKHFDEDKIIASDVVILTTYSSRLDPRILRELQMHRFSEVFKGNKNMEAIR